MIPEMPAPVRVSFLGGNGHCAARLAAARPFLTGIELDEVPYPGFEGRPRAADLGGFLTAIASHLRASAPARVYATGIGGLLALRLRARGELADASLLLQGPVLWGLERRAMPRLLRLGPARLLPRLFATSTFRGNFTRTHFTHPPAPETLAVFFDGYARCPAAPDLFEWLSPSLLRSLERDLAARPAALDEIGVWWGGRDRVVSLRELEWTSGALGLDGRWPLRIFPDWGHYPMIDQPAAWAEALSDVVARAGAV
jgi:pimeloyl-ACP methyl ester carboxylesterase